MEIKKSEFKKNTIYIWQVDYNQKPNETYDVITQIHYYQWDDEEKTFKKYRWVVHRFAKDIYNKYLCFAGKESGDKLVDAVEVIAYKQDDKEYWIKTKPNETVKDNFSFLEYAKKHGFAELVK